MSVGMVVTSFLGVKEEHFTLSILDNEQAASAMEPQPPVSVMMRVDRKATDAYNKKQLLRNLSFYRDSDAGDKSSLKSSSARVVITIKYKQMVVHRPLDVSVRVSKTLHGHTGTGVIHLKTHQRDYKYIRQIKFDFFPNLRRFITELVNNINFIEDQDETNRHNELMYRKFIIFPEGDGIGLRRRVHNDIHSATVTFDWKEGRFLGEIEGEKQKEIHSFNHFLLSEFLQINAEDKLLIRHALGYQRDVDLFTSQQQDLCTLLAPADPSAMTEIEQAGPLITPKEKDHILNQLSTAIGIKEATKIPRWKSPPEEVKCILFTILKSVVTLHTSNDKMDWIDRGMLELAMQVVLRNGDGDQSYNTVPIKIIRHLLEGNEKGCLRLGYRLVPMLTETSGHCECTGIYQVIDSLISLPTFRRLFVENLGTSRLLNMYVRVSILLLGENANPVSDLERPVDSSPDGSFMEPDAFDENDYLYESEEDDEEEDEETQSPKSAPNEQADTMASIILSPKGKLLIPRLSLPTGPELAPAVPKLNKTEVEFRRTPVEELTELAVSAGESFVTSNLTAILSFQRGDSQVKTRKQKVKSSGRRASSATNTYDQILLKSLMSIRSSGYYQIKCWILRTLSKVTQHWENLQYLPNPVNLLYSELLVARNNPLLSKDDEFLSLLYENLGNYAHYAEHRHLNLWSQQTRNMTMDRALRFRKRIDTFIYRVHNRLSPASEKRDFVEIETQLNILADYMQACPTRIMSNQVSDVCMETLLRIEEHVLARGRINPDNMDLLGIINAVLRVVDSMILQNTHPALDQFLCETLIHHKERWRFFRHYSCQILFNETIGRNYILKNRFRDAQSEVKMFRRQIIHHFHCCLTLAHRYLQAKNTQVLEELAEDTPKPVKPKKPKELFRMFEFLLHPTQGYVLRILSQVKGTTQQFILQTELLDFLQAAFSIENSYFLKRKNYVDAYISYAYLSFIKLYHNVEEDARTFELIYRLLDLLVTFSGHKNEHIMQKFYQLRVMDFLVHQISLEYEITRMPHRPKSLETTALLSARDKVASPRARPESATYQLTRLATKSDLLSPTDRKPAMLSPKSSVTILSPPRQKRNGSHVVRKKEKIILHADPRSLRKAKNREMRASMPPKLRLTDAKNALLMLGQSEGAHLNELPESEEASAPWDDEVPHITIEKSDRSSCTSSEESEESEESDDSSEEYEDSTSTEGEEETEEESEEEESTEEEEETEEESEEEEDEEEESSSEEPTPTPGGLKFAIPKLQNCPTKGGNTPVKPKPIAALSLAGVGKGKPLIPSLMNCPVKGSDGEMRAGSSVEINVERATGNLSKLEEQAHSSNVKWQLILQKAKAEGNEAEEENSRNEQEIRVLYHKERQKIKMYRSQRVHLSLLQLILSLLITPQGTLDPLYTDQFPLDNKKLNIPFLLREHIVHYSNQNLIPPLTDAAFRMGRDVTRVLKLVCPALFRKDIYNDLTRMAIGAYGTVYRCRVKPDCQTMSVAIKLMEVPKNIHDRCVMHDIFDEVLVLDRFKSDTRISHMYDFGTDGEYYWITMKKYKCSLKYWREKQTAPLEQNLALYLNIYMNVLNTFQFLTEKNVNHFDVKCDNFLIQPLNEENWTPEDEEHFWKPVTDIPNFSVCIADFGEAKVYSSEIDGYTTRNRGTEFTKSPEMLAVAYASQKTRSTYDRRKKVGASSPSDIWSLGCLLYELLTGEFLFYDQDWVRFYIRVTAVNEELITPEKRAKINDNKILVEFLRFILCRDPRMRPSIHDVIKRFKHVRSRLISLYPASYSPRIPTPRSTGGDKKVGALFVPIQSSETSALPKRERETIPRSATTQFSMPSVAHSSPRQGRVAPFATGPDVAPVKSSPRLGEGSKIEIDITMSEPSTKKETPTTLPLLHSISEDKLPITGRKKTRKLPEHFLKNMSEITPFLFLASEKVGADRDLLKKEGVTHLLNCTGSPIAYPMQFVTLDVHISLACPQELVTCLDSIVSFIESARHGNGKVLVYSQDGLNRSALVVIGYLMATEHCTYFEAFVRVHNCRYVIDPDEPFVKELVKFYQSRQRCNIKQYQCLCGACSYTVTLPYPQSVGHTNPLSCSCTVDSPSPHCPNVGCRDFIQQMRTYYNYQAREVLWGFTSRDNLTGDLHQSTQEFRAEKDLTALPIPPSKIQSLPVKEWKVYKCTSCDFITHAVRDKSKKGDYDVAVVINIPVGFPDGLFSPKEFGSRDGREIRATS